MFDAEEEEILIQFVKEHSELFESTHYLIKVLKSPKVQKCFTKWED